MSLSMRARWRILKRDNFTCQYCGKNFLDDENIKLEVDHILPISKGGIDNPKNLITACYACNHGKHADRFQMKVNVVKERKPKPKCELPTTQELLDQSKQLREQVKRKFGISIDDKIDFFQYKDGNDFLKKTGMTHDEAIQFLDQELKAREIYELKNNTNVDLNKYPRTKRFLEKTGMTLNEAFRWTRECKVCQT